MTRKCETINCLTTQNLPHQTLAAAQLSQSLAYLVSTGYEVFLGPVQPRRQLSFHTINKHLISLCHWDTVTVSFPYYIKCNDNITMTNMYCMTSIKHLNQWKYRCYSTRIACTLWQRVRTRIP